MNISGQSRTLRKLLGFYFNSVCRAMLPEILKKRHSTQGMTGMKVLYEKESIKQDKK
jgi:hypothetical protein